MKDNSWARILAYVTGLINQELLLRNEYLAAENRILRAHLSPRLRLTDPERSTLAEVGKRLGELLRTSDVKCRYGGDEFLLILPDTPAAGSRQLAESLRREMSRLALPTAGGELKVTISVGVVTASKNELDAQAVIARADQALYRAKHAGRNRVVAAEADGDAPLRLINAAG